MARTIESLEQIQKAINHVVKKGDVSWVNIWRELKGQKEKTRKDTNKSDALKSRIISHAAKGHLKIPEELYNFMNIRDIEKIKGKEKLEKEKFQTKLDFEKGGVDRRRVEKTIEDIKKEVKEKEGSKYKTEKENFLKNVLVKNPLKNPDPERLKNNLFKFGIKERKCEMCGNDRWLGKLLTLEIHHEADENDYRLDKIKLLCPNCHSLTRSYKVGN